MLTEDQVGLTRRQLLERGAVLGGAVLAAQGLGAVSAFAQTSPPPPDPTDPPDPPDPDPTDPPDPIGTLPENFQLVVDFDGRTYGVKYVPGEGWTQLRRGGACTFNSDYDYRSSPPLLATMAAGASVTTGTDPEGHAAYILVLPDDVTFVEGRPKDDSCGVGRDPCGGHVEQLPDGTYAFAACDH